MKTPTPHEKYQQQVRAKWKSCTPYRLGMAVGEAGDNLPSPYQAGTRGDHSYLDGVEHGRIAREVDLKAQELYRKSTANDPIVHTNRFPVWDELSGNDRWQWRKKAMEVLGC